MKSPFPGMDPYLEARWGDVHHRLVTYSSDAIQPQLPSGLKARVEERVYFEDGRSPRRSIFPDVRVVEAIKPPIRGGGGTAMLERPQPQPLIIETILEPITEGFIQIIDAKSGGRVITVIEFLSPTNKMPGEGQRRYRQKQDEAMAAGANLVEIDLLREGERIQLAPEALIPLDYRTPYRTCVSRNSRVGKYEIYAMPLREPLPPIAIPLRDTDEDVILELQPLIEQCYRNGAYDDLDYSREPEPPLPPSEADWAHALLKAQGFRES